MNQGNREMPVRDRPGQDPQGYDMPNRDQGAFDGRAGRDTKNNPGSNGNSGNSMRERSSAGYDRDRSGFDRSGFDRSGFDRFGFDRQRCKDRDCHAPIAWRNTEDVLSRGIYHNQEERDIQVKLLDIVAVAGLPLADIAGLGSNPPSFSALPSSHRGGSGGEAPQQRTMAWVCAKFDAERDRREWFFQNRVQQRNCIPSPYCEAHTCRFFFTKERCTFKKPIYDAVCNKHAVCPAFSCREGKGQVVDPSHTDPNTCQFLRHEFCSDHRCSAPNCELLRDEVKDRQMGDYCPSHRCHYKGCIKKALERRGYCAKHKCQSGSCQKISVAGFELCKAHVKCNQRDCSQPRFIVPDSRAIEEKDRKDCVVEVFDRKLYLSYCKDHGFCADKSCSGLRTKAAVHCRKHACFERGCNSGCRDKIKYCDTHRCKMPYCISPKGWKEDNKTREEFCFAHLCRESDCTAGVPDMHMYCEDHECDIVSCVAKAADGVVCIEHSKLRYTKEAKAAAKRETTQWVNVLRSPGSDPIAAAAYGGPYYPPSSSMASTYGQYRPPPFFPSSAHSQSSRSGSPPESPRHRDRDRDRDRYRDRDGDRDRRGGRFRRDSRSHTPTSSDGSLYHGDSDGFTPQPARSSSRAQTRVPVQVQQPQPPVARPIPRDGNRPADNNNPGNANNGVNYRVVGNNGPANGPPSGPPKGPPNGPPANGGNDNNNGMRNPGGNQAGPGVNIPTPVNFAPRPPQNQQDDDEYGDDDWYGDGR